MSTKTISPEEYDAFRKMLEDACGIVLGENKHYLVTSRLTRLMSESDIGSLGELLNKIKVEPSLRQRILDAMTTNETSWFRDNYPYDVLKEKLLPELAAQKVNPIKIWSAACSTGQEPYSISMVVSEYLMSRPGSIPMDCVQITGTDISSEALLQAKNGSYEGMSVTRGLSEERKQRFFRQNKDSWEVIPDVRKRISYRELNLKNNFTLLGKFDVIFCRNVLIYFSAELKKDIMYRMAQALKPDGYLILGGSESISGYSEDFSLVRWKSGVIYQLKNQKHKRYG